jgi:hypothetical protein
VPQQKGFFFLSLFAEMSQIFCKFAADLERKRTVTQEICLLKRAQQQRRERRNGRLALEARR